MNLTSIPGNTAHPLPEHQSDLLHLPFELIEHIAIRIRDVDSMLSFARTCTRFAAVSKLPEFVETLSDTLVEERRVMIASCDGAEIRAARIYDLARKLGGRMKSRHMNRLASLLPPKDQAERNEEIALDSDFELYAETTQVNAPFNPEHYAVNRASTAYRNRVAIFSAALLAGQINGLNAELKEQAERILWTVWEHPSNATDALVHILTERISASEPTLAGHAALGVWLFLERSLSAPDDDCLRSHASSVLDWCASKPVAIKIDVMEKIVEWSMTCCPVSKLSGGIERDDGSVVFSPELKAFLSYKLYRDQLDESAEFAEPLNPELSQRFFAMLDLALTNLVRNGMPTSTLQLDFAKMLPALPWREGCKTGLRWLVNALKHHEAMHASSMEYPAGIGVPSVDDEAADELPVPFALKDHESVFVDEIEALLPRGIFSEKELAYLMQSISDGTFSWEALDKIDPLPSTAKGTSAKH